MSCGKHTPEENVDEAILAANIALSNFDCDKAITILETLGRQNDHAKYLQILSSAYACKSGFDAPTLFATDMALTASPAPMGGMAKYSTSSTMDDHSNTEYLNLQTAIDILLYAGGILTTQQPSITERATRFTASEAGDINAQILYLMLAQLGKFYYYYGNSSATGVKGSGTQISANACFIQYENLALLVGVDLNTLIAAGGGACNGAGVGFPGHMYLGTGGANISLKRACQGVVLLNNLMELIPAVAGSMTGGDISTISSLTAGFAAAKTLLQAGVPAGKLAGVNRLLETLSQARCQEENATDDDAIQYYYAYFFEVMFQ